MKKNFIKLSFFAAIAAVFTGCSLFHMVDVTVDLKVSVTGVTLDCESISMEEGSTKTLTATVEPENATNKNISWKSCDESIATVEDGKVTFVSEGTTTIIVTTEDGEKTASCKVTVCEKTIKPSETEPYVITNANETTFTITPDDLGLANYWLSKDEKTIYLGGKKVFAEDGVTVTDYETENYTLTGTFNGQIVIEWKDIEISLSGATITNENAPAIIGLQSATISAKKGTDNYVTSTGTDDERKSSAAIYMQDDEKDEKKSVEFGGKGTLYVTGSICHGVKAKKVELKGSGTYYFQGASDGSAVNCNSVEVEEEKSFTAYFKDSKNGIKADNTIDIASGTFYFAGLKNALKTDTKADDDAGEEKDHYIHLTGGTFYYDSTVENFAVTEDGAYTYEGAAITNTSEKQPS